MTKRMNNDWRLVDAESGEPVVESLEVADGYWSRLVGWQMRRPPHSGHGLLLVPCSSIHTFFVRFALDLVMLDRNGTVLATRRNVRPWRAIVGSQETHAMLEIPAPGPDLRVGQSLWIEHKQGTEIPKSLRFLDKR